MVSDDGEFDMTQEEIDALYARQSRKIRNVAIGFCAVGVAVVAVALTAHAVHGILFVGTGAVFVGLTIYFTQVLRNHT